jgi:hypothetical protein
MAAQAITPGSSVLTKIIDIIVVGALSSLMLTQTGCPDDKSAEETGPASSRGEATGQASGESETGEDPQPAPVRPEAMFMLCTLGAGWCAGGCPQASTGPLCCAGETCVPWSEHGLACDGVVGWCLNYSTAGGIDRKTGLKIATCHDVG